MTRLLLPVRVLSLILAGSAACAQQPFQHAPDGGTREHIDSIDIPPIANAPFSAVVVTEITRILPDGSKRITGNHRLVARDSAGRVFQERRHFSPTGATEQTPLGQTSIVDPNQHEMTLCDTMRSCRTYTMPVGWANRSAPAAPQPLVTLPNGITIRNEALGRENLQGVDVTGSRETTTIPAGKSGNEKAEDLVKEFWYSPQLGINVLTKRTEPITASVQTFTVTKLSLVEPDRKLFEPPPDYKITRVEPQR